MGKIMYFSGREKGGSTTFRRNLNSVADSQPNRDKTKVLRGAGQRWCARSFAQTPGDFVFGRHEDIIGIQPLIAAMRASNR
jgi:hypothetical protein